MHVAAAYCHALRNDAQPRCYRLSPRGVTTHLQAAIDNADEDDRRTGCRSRRGIERASGRSVSVKICTAPYSPIPRNSANSILQKCVRHLGAAPPCKTVTPRRSSNCGNTRCAAPPCDSSVWGQQASTCAIAQGRRVSSTTSLTMHGSGSRSRNRRVNGESGGAEQGTTHRRSPSTHSAMRFCFGAIEERVYSCPTRRTLLFECGGGRQREGGEGGGRAI